MRNPKTTLVVLVGALLVASAAPGQTMPSNLSLTTLRGKALDAMRTPHRRLGGGYRSLVEPKPGERAPVTVKGVRRSLSRTFTGQASFAKTRSTVNAASQLQPTSYQATVQGVGGRAVATRVNFRDGRPDTKVVLKTGAGLGFPYRMIQATQYRRDGDNWTRMASGSVKLMPGLLGGKAVVQRNGAWQRPAYFEHVDGRPANLARSQNFNRVASWLGMD
jgi:hypothetical protein